MEIHTDTRTAAHIREHGGRLYVWLDSAGVQHVRLTEPRRPVQFRPIYADGFAFWLMHDEAIDPPEFWTVKLRRFPLRHIDVLYNGRAGYADGAGG